MTLLNSLLSPIGNDGWDGTVDTYADLPPAADHYGEIWAVTTSTGIWPFNHPAGLYISDGSTWNIFSAFNFPSLSGTLPITYNSTTGEISTQMNPSRLLGRPDSGVGVAQEIALQDGLYFDSNNLGMLDITPRDVTATGAVTGDNLSGTNTGDVTLDAAVSFIYFSAPGSQELIIDPVDLSLSSDATGILADARFPALTGDVTTAAGSVATAIANLAVTNAKIANSTIDLTAKVTGILPPANGGTGINNSALTINLASGAVGRVLASDGSGNATWQALSGLGVTSITGTANQINASAATGAVTLSLPSAIVTPGTLSVNGTLRSNSSTTLNATGPYNLSVRGTQTTDTGGTLPQAGILIESIFSPTGNSASAIGGITNISRFIAASTRTLGLCAANYAAVNSSGNVGTISILSHFYSDTFVAVGGTVGAAYGFCGKDPNTGTVAQAAYFDNLSVGYPSVDLKGTNKSIFSGNAGFGNSAPNGVLHATVPDATFGNSASFILSTSANSYELRAGISATNGYAWLGSTQRGVSSRPLYLYGSPGVGINVVPLNALDVNGGAAFGTYAGFNTPGSNSIIVSGGIAAGTSTNSNRGDFVEPGTGVECILRVHGGTGASLSNIGTLLLENTGGGGGTIQGKISSGYFTSNYGLKITPRLDAAGLVWFNDCAVGIGTLPTTTLHSAETKVLSAGLSDGYSASYTLTPTYSGAFTVTRHNYIDVNNVALVSSAAVTDAAVFRFNAAAGTHKAVDSGTTKTTPGTVDAWVKVNINGTIYYLPAYTSKTS